MTLHDSLETFRESAEASLSLTVAYLPKLLSAVLLVLVGYLLARIVGAGTAGLLRLVGLDRLLAKTPIQTLFARSGSTKTGADVLGLLVFWLIFLPMSATSAWLHTPFGCTHNDSFADLMGITLRKV